ncbi:MAG: winged helix-turn-helix domain-containing protein [Lentisphaeria bacterium]|nr:winged helix-turn-helix domain-containing protein [Lentisphaeria bacterium]
MMNTDAKMIILPENGVVRVTKTMLDLKSSSLETRMAVRASAYSLFRCGHKTGTVARMLGVNVVTVKRWLKAFRSGDLRIFHGEKVRGGGVGSGRLLDERQMAELRDAVAAAHPVDYQLPFRRWTFAAVAELVKAKFGVKVSRVTAGKWLASGFGLKPSDGAETEDT